MVKNIVYEDLSVDEIAAAPANRSDRHRCDRRRGQARGVGEAVQALVAPTIPVGMAQHHLGFAGSMALRPSTLIAVLLDMVESLTRRSFEHFYFINGHGGNIASVTAAFRDLCTA